MSRRHPRSAAVIGSRKTVCPTHRPGSLSPIELPATAADVSVKPGAGRAGSSDATPPQLSPPHELIRRAAR